MTGATMHYFGYILAIGLTFLCGLFCLGCSFAGRCIVKAWREDRRKEDEQHKARAVCARWTDAPPINGQRNDWEGEGPAPIPRLDSHAPGA